MPVTDVAALLTRWRASGGVLARGRLAVEATRLLAGLTPDERRVVARALADQGAPQLAARIGERTGHEVDAAQLRTAASGLLALDRDQLDQLAATLADPVERERLARAVLEPPLDDAGGPPPPRLHDAGGPPPPRLDDRLPAAPFEGGSSWLADELATLPPPGTPVPPDSAAVAPVEVAMAPSTRDLRGVAGLHAIALGEIPLDDVELGDQALDHPGLGEAGLLDTDVVALGLHEIDLDVAAPDDVAVDGGAPDDVAADDLPSEHLAPDPESFEPAPEEPTPPTAASDAAIAAGVATTAGATLLDDLRRADNAPTRLAAIRRADLAVTDPEVALTLLDTVPEGWQRRRLALRLAERGSLPVDDLPSLLRRFPRPTDTVFVVGALLDEAAIGPDALDGLLDPRTARRLTLRAGR